jgi:chromosome segregation protein
MYLQKLEIIGFKSFAKKTVFEFSRESTHDKKARSITGIVGPNGSGKSNVADAIRWVLGEQSFKLIRCKKADDVIFHGSQTKARQGFAEVSLFLNNEDKELEIEYSEVVLTRRVYRDGETEYLINKNKVRLFDILMLCAKANFGQRSYSIVGQGMVDHIINISAFERKEFFDEATGVKQYQIKRDQSVNRLKHSRENLEKSNHILAELEPRLRLLTRQIKKLEQRKEIEESLRAMQRQYYGAMWHDLQKNITRQREDFNIKDVLKKDLEFSLNNLQISLAQLAREESRKDIFNELQKDYNKLNADKNELLKELTMIKGKMSLEYVKVGKQNLSWMENKKEEIDARIKEIKESLRNAENKLVFTEETLKTSEIKYKEIEESLAVWQNNLNAAEIDLARIKSGDRSSGSFESVKAILRQRSFIDGIFGTVADLGKTDKMYEVALATAAGNRLSGIVVQNDEVAVKCINYLKQNRLAPVTFFPLNKLNARDVDERSRNILGETGAIGFAVELLSFDPKYKKVFQLIFGNTIVIDNLDSAKRIGIGRERMVTLEGDVSEKTGVMKGGFRRPGFVQWFSGSDEQKLATQEEKLKEIALLKSKIETGMRDRNNLLHEVNELKIQIQVNETKNKGLSNDLEGLQKEINQINRDIEENQISPGDQDRYLKNLNSQKTEFENKIEALEVQIAKSRQTIDAFNLEEEKKRQEVFRLQKEMQDFQNRLNDISREVNDVNISLAKLETKKEDLEKEITQELGADVKIEELSRQEFLNLDSLWFEIGKLKHNLELIGGIDEEVINEHKEVSERYEFLHNQVLDLDKAIVDLEKIVVELDEIINKNFNTAFKKINEAFANYFEKIFSGGKAKLELIQKEKPENLGLSDSEAQRLGDSEISEEKTVLVSTGVEIMAAPPGKKVDNIAVLSGGERTMTSLALICAIIDSNPAPFVVMDEVDAALDEANSEKFAAIIQDLSYKAQFIVITHNRVVMHVADVLYGVAISDDGISKTLSLNLKEAEGTVKK